jgi:APA family basic amino acid/polyamine antiporter
MAGLPWQTWERLLIWLALGFVVYFAYSRRRAREAGSAEREA